MEGQGQCRVVQYRVERDRKRKEGRKMETEEGRNLGDKEQR